MPVSAPASAGNARSMVPRKAMSGRLLSLNNYYYRRGGAESLMFAHDALFQQHGWETAVFSMQHPRNLDSPWREYFIDELELGQPYSPWRKLVMSGKTIYSWEAKSKLRRLLERFLPDVAHAHNIYHHISPSVLGVLRERGVPTTRSSSWKTLDWVVWRRS